MRVLLLLLLLTTLGTRARAQGTPLGGDERAADIQLINCERINTAGNDFGPMPYRNNLVYVTRPRRGNLNPATGLNYYELFLAGVNPDGLPGRGKRFSVELNGGYNEGPVSFANEERVIYFTRTQLRSGVPVTDRSGKANLGIFSAFRAQYDWDAVRALPFNGPEFSNQHPSVTADGKRIFFSSNRPGGFGGFDLYFSDYRDGRWAPAINLGAEINSEGNEAFPYIHADSVLYFASDGHGGRGGYDVLRIDLSERRWGPLLHLPAPINGPADDLGFVLRSDGTGGYLVSNRAGGKGADDIYLLQFENGLSDLDTERRETRTMVLSDAATSRRLAGASVWLAEIGPDGELPAAYAALQLPAAATAGNAPLLQWTARPPAEIARPPIRSATDGTLDLELAEGKTYEAVVLHPDFQPERFRFLFQSGRTSRPLDLSLQPRACTLVSGRVTYAGEEGEVLGAVAGARVSVRVGTCGQAVVNVPPPTITDGSGFYQLCLPRNCDYELQVSPPDQRYPGATVSQPLRASELAGGVLSNLQINLYAAPLATDALSGSVLPLPGLRFTGPGGSGTSLALGSESALQLIAELRRQYPGRALTLIAHDDGPLPSERLHERSAERLRSLLNALARRGVSTEGIQQLALDNAYPVTLCSSGNCTEEEYGRNRRIELRVE